MPPEPLRYSAPDGPDHASVDFAAGLSPNDSPNPERSPPVKLCGHRNPCNCGVLRARIHIPGPPAPMAPSSPAPTLPAAGDPPSAPTNGHQSAKPTKRTPHVAARLEVAQARDRLAQEWRRWPRASHAPHSAAAPSGDLAESSPRESTTGSAAASTAPTVADSSSSAPSRPSPNGASLHRTMRLAPGEMHVRAAEANLANAMLRLVSLTPATDRSAADIDNATSATLASTEEAQRAVDGANASAPTISQPPVPPSTWVRPLDWMLPDWRGACARDRNPKGAFQPPGLTRMGVEGDPVSWLACAHTTPRQKALRLTD